MGMLGSNRTNVTLYTRYTGKAHPTANRIIDLGLPALFAGLILIGVLWIVCLGLCLRRRARRRQTQRHGLQSDQQHEDDDHNELIPLIGTQSKDERSESDQQDEHDRLDQYDLVKEDTTLAIGAAGHSSTELIPLIGTQSKDERPESDHQQEHDAKEPIDTKNMQSDLPSETISDINQHGDSGVTTLGGRQVPLTHQPSHVAARDAMDMTPEHESDWEADFHNLGKIQFSIQYDLNECTLYVKIMRALGLPAKDLSGTSDPYVKIMLLPADKKYKRKTEIKKKKLNPRWNETFSFEAFPPVELQYRTLQLRVVDYDRFTRNDLIGEVAIPLDELDLAAPSQDKPILMWKALQPCKASTAKLGELLISLCYVPVPGTITIDIIKARQLKAKDINGTSDPYVKIWMYHAGKKVEKQKTSIKDRNLNPEFNEIFTFYLPYEKIKQTIFRITVMDYDLIGRNELIGYIALGSDRGLCSSMEIKHWHDMFLKPKQSVVKWHILRDFGY